MLLVKEGFIFTVFPIKVSENLKKNLNVDEQIIDIARRKARAAYSEYKPLNSNNFLILAADTMVVQDNQALGKPESEKIALDMLNLLSGRSHEVKTAVCLLEGATQKLVCGLETTKVYFRTILRQEILDYIATGEPMDKAGAYAIQGRGGKFVEKFEGSFDNVVGLPVDLVRRLLKDNNWKV